MELKPAIVACQNVVNAKLKEYISTIPSPANKLNEAMEYALLLGGKRVRPFLVMTVANIFGVSNEKAVIPACAIECIHAYSLVHDDLPAMDDDELRRGHKTVHIAFDEATAILAGDALQTLAFDILSNADDKLANQLKMVSVLAKASGAYGMCGGQELDLLSENKKITQSELENVHKHKTGALLEAAVELGLLSAENVDKTTYDAFISYSRKIGLAFQVWDDVLDIISDTETLGKQQGADLELNKSTYPNIMGLEKAKEYAKELVKSAIEDLSKLSLDTKILQDFAKYLVERNF
ncbi:MAG: (2E,6E)-farnesyl diphosphate synthase [Ruminobacter sp.]|nr:(2E,6E)-farnesyl diphosphate synthase [Ruminobacter sp.]